MGKNSKTERIMVKTLNELSISQSIGNITKPKSFKPKLTAGAQLFRNAQMLAKRARETSKKRDLNNPNYEKSASGMMHSGLVGMRVQAAQGQGMTGTTLGLTPEIGKYIVGAVKRTKQIGDNYRRVSRIAKRGLGEEMINEENTPSIGRIILEAAINDRAADIKDIVESEIISRGSYLVEEYKQYISTHLYESDPDHYDREEIRKSDYKPLRSTEIGNLPKGKKNPKSYPNRDTHFERELEDRKRFTKEEFEDYEYNIKNLYEEILEEGGPTRKHFKQAAELISKISSPIERAKAAQQHAQLFSQQNERFNKDKFFEACGVPKGGVLGMMNKAKNDR